MIDILKESMVACGTVCSNQPGYPKTIDDLKKNTEKGAVCRYRRDKLLLMKWKDSTTAQLFMCAKNFLAPSAVKNYKNYIGGFDLYDMLIGYYQVLYKIHFFYKIPFH